MTANRKLWEGLQLGIILAMFITAAVRWSSVPDRIPTHWNAAGEVDGYGGKFVGLLLLPIVVLGIYAMLAVLPKIDPAKANYASFRGPYLVLRTVLVAYMGYIYILLNIAITHADTFPVDRFIFGAVALLLLIMGLLMGKIRPNYFVGIRTPWTLTSKLSWVKTHRMGGWVFIASGIASGIGAIFGGTPAIITMFAVLGPGIIYLVVYSYMVWRTDPDRVAAQDTRPGSDSAAR